MKKTTKENKPNETKTAATTNEKKTIPELLMELANRFDHMEKNASKAQQLGIVQLMALVTLRNAVKLMDTCFEKIGV